MKEALLHCIWEHQLFDKRNLRTDSGEKLQILDQGELNDNAGPDFSQAKVRIANMEWFGAIEIHEKSSHWFAHAHDTDPAYNRTVLHVVWDNNRPTQRQDQSLIPTLSLAGIVGKDVLGRAERLLNQGGKQPCASHLANMQKDLIQETFSNALNQRMARKQIDIEAILAEVDYDWEELSYRLLARALGSHINAEAMYNLAKRVPLKYIRRCGHDSKAIQALLLLVSGLEERATRPKSNLEKNDFAFLTIKFDLQDSIMSPNWWRFSRLRPANFPTVRIAQLAVLLAENEHLFTLLVKHDAADLRSRFRTVHETSAAVDNIRPIGLETIDGIIRNVSAPLMFAFSDFVGNADYKLKGLQHLRDLRPENNRITREWLANGINLHDSYDAQGAIEQFNANCLQKKCLSCPIGQEMIKGVCF